MLQFISRFLHGFKVEDVLSEDAVEKLARASDVQQAAGAQQTADMIMGFSAAGLLWTVIFSGVGVFAFLYGKRKANAIYIIDGILLLAYPILIKDTTMIVLVGLALSAVLFFFKK
ncbi:MAG TPA: hypothetical protein PKJ42_09340 [Candidatus Goldiibacteriota bacterium]|nr:hypothetical protein [Candidatus Goldiibacteriota bacterium]